jgi:[ribosomal protein S18]-alanine N-acetyltransferase
MAAEARRKESGVKIRPLRSEDASAVTRILREVPEAASWSGQSIEEASAWSGGILVVSENDGEVNGFLLGRQIADEGEILNLGVMPARRRRGEGSALLATALREFIKHGASRVFLEVRESNRIAIAFYTKHGFHEIGRRKGYYREPQEAAVLMRKKLGQAEERSV